MGICKQLSFLEIVQLHWNRKWCLKISNAIVNLLGNKVIIYIIITQLVELIDIMF